MSRLIVIAVVSLAVIGTVLSAVAAESLWTDDSKGLYTDKKAASVGDLLTIIIVESAASSQQATTDAKKSSGLSNEPGIGPFLKNLPMMSYGLSDNMKANGSTSRTSTLSAKITVKVTKIDENGNLEIEGTRFVQTNREKAEMKLTGTVRPQDVSVDNTILSTYIANARIAYQGSGPIGDRQKEGLITKLLHWIF